MEFLKTNNTLLSSSLPILRQVGLHDRELLEAADKLAMLKVWLALEVRQFISLSIQDVSITLRFSLRNLLTLYRFTDWSSLMAFAQIIKRLRF
jgi:hypothetical protein